MSAGTYPISVIAKLLLLTERRIQQLTKEGHLPKGERGKYELVPVVQAYVRYLRDRAIAGDAAGGEMDDKRRLAKARADIAEFEAQRLAHELVPVEEVEKQWTEITARFRARALGVAPKAAPMVAMETETEACHEIIETFVHEALAELASTEVEDRDAAGAGGSGGDAGGGAASEADDLGVG